MRKETEIMNSDERSHFTWPANLELLDSCDAKGSINGKSLALHNVQTERFFCSLKYDDLYFKEYETQKEVITGILNYIQAYYAIRPHASLGGGITPHVFCQSKSTHHPARTKLVLSYNSIWFNLTLHS